MVARKLIARRGDNKRSPTPPIPGGGAERQVEILVAYCGTVNRSLWVAASAGLAC